jgi:hypothetical protein
MSPYFKPQTKTHRLKHRLAGTPQEYWTLELILDGSVIDIHTSKSLSYIKKRIESWVQKSKEMCSFHNKI